MTTALKIRRRKRPKTAAMQPDELIRIRKRLGLTQAEFASKLGVRPLTISLWERGKTPIAKARALAIQAFVAEFPDPARRRSEATKKAWVTRRKKMHRPDSSRKLATGKKDGPGEQHSINWVYFPRSQEAPGLVWEVVRVFELAAPRIHGKLPDIQSNTVLSLVRPGLEKLGFQVEAGKATAEKIKVPVLFGTNGRVEKSFEADAWHRQGGMVVEVESGRGWVNNQFLKDLFQACMMHDVDYCGIAVRNLYKKMRNFESVVAFFETLYTSRRLTLPLKGVLIIGY